MNGEHKPNRLKTQSMVVLGVLAALVAVWLLVRQGHTNFSEPKDRLTGPSQTNTNQSLSFATTSPSSGVSTNLSVGVGTSQSVATNSSGRMNKDTMLRQLNKWVQKREGYEIRIITAQEVLDLDSNPKSLNVIVTKNQTGELTAQQLKGQLDDATVRERTLKEQLLKARQEEDIAGVNRLVAELTDARTAFVTNTGVSFYKLSLTKELPPVLAYWPGLPFETVREQSARSIAEARLGNQMGLQNLQHYTTATALLHFTNSSGGSIYVDPFRMTEVSIKTLQVLHKGRIQRNDVGRDGRIVKQWADYLQP